MKKHTDLIEEQIRETGQEEVERFLKNLRPTIRTVLESALISLLGFEKRYGDISIDHCNGRASVLNDAIRDIALKDIKSLVSSKLKLSAYLPLIEQTLDKEIKSQLGYIIRREVEEQIKPEIKRLVAEKLPDKVREAMKIVVDQNKAKGKTDNDMPF